MRSYPSTARKQGYSLLCSLKRVLVGKPLVFQQATVRAGVKKKKHTLFPSAAKAAFSLISLRIYDQSLSF
jgi:hypothetical protein